MKLYLLIMWIRGMYGWNFMKIIEVPKIPTLRSLCSNIIPKDLPVSDSPTLGLLVKALPTSKYCVNCKYSMIDPKFPNKIEFSRCTAFPFEDYMLEPPINPVTGELEGELPYHEKFYRCSSSRALEHKCGKHGKRFVPKDPKK
jgi:hypothetical protein